MKINHIILVWLFPYYCQAEPKFEWKGLLWLMDTWRASEQLHWLIIFNQTFLYMNWYTTWIFISQLGTEKCTKQGIIKVQDCDLYFFSSFLRQRKNTDWLHRQGLINNYTKL